MTKEFREQGLIMNERLEEYDGTTAIVRTEHLPAEEVEFLRWKAERWMKVHHIPAALRHDPRFCSVPGLEDAAAYVSGKLGSAPPWGWRVRRKCLNGIGRFGESGAGVRKLAG